MIDWKDYRNNRLFFTTPLPAEQLLSRIPLNSKVLDVGCGYGRTLEYLFNKGYHNLYGIDVSENYIQTAQATIPSACLQVADMLNFEYGEKRYDFILLMGVIEYVLLDKEQDVFFEKISKALTNNGMVLLETFLIDCSLNWRQYLQGFLKNRHWGRFTNSKGFECHHQTVHQLLKLLSKNFIIDSFQKQSFLTWTGNICNGGHFILKHKELSNE